MMSLVITRRKQGEMFQVIDYCKGHKFIGLKDDTFAEPLEIKAWLSPIVFQRGIGKGVTLSESKLPLDDTASRAAIWKTLYKDKPLPNIEKGAVNRYAGFLDKYLPANIPAEKIIRHAKG